MVFDSAPGVSADWQKHFSMYLDKVLNFNPHIKEKTFRAMKGIVNIQKLNKTLPRHSPIAIYKSILRPHLDYGDIIYNQPHNESFKQNIEKILYSAALVISGAIKKTSQSKLYNELGFESQKFRHWFRKLCTFLKFKTSGLPEYLFDLIPQNNHLYNTHFLEDVTTFHSRTDAFKYYFFPSTILEWNKLGRKIRQSSTLLTFRNSLLKIG